MTPFPYLDQDGNPIRAHVGRETVRASTCPKCPSKRTEDFRGVNEHGWIFRCSGTATREPHQFIAEPAT